MTPSAVAIRAVVVRKETQTCLNARSAARATQADGNLLMKRSHTPLTRGGIERKLFEIILIGYLLLIGWTLVVAYAGGWL